MVVLLIKIEFFNRMLINKRIKQVNDFILNMEHRKLANHWMRKIPRNQD